MLGGTIPKRHPNQCIFPTTTSGVRCGSDAAWTRGCATSTRRLGALSQAGGTFAESDTQRTLRVKANNLHITNCTFKLAQHRSHIAPVYRDHIAGGHRQLGRNNEGLRHVLRGDFLAQQVTTHVIGFT